MNQKFASNNIENDNFSLNSEEGDFEILITRLAEISKTIALLKKNYPDKV